MDIEEIRRKHAELGEAIEKCEKAQRNWPEKIMCGMLFRHKRLRSYYIFSGARFAFDPASGNGFVWDLKEQFEYIGHAHDHLTLREPKAGANPVGEMCEFSDDGQSWGGMGKCTDFDPSRAHPHQRGNSAWFKFARIYHY